MTEWIFDIFEENYLKILNSKKEVEGRVPDPTKERKQYNKIKRGDSILIRVVDKKFQPVDSIKPLEFIASYNKKYNSVKEMLESERLERVLPEVNSIEEGIKLYHNLPGYEERIKENGIYAIGLESKI
jgi:ASC-1-like (ASCH) protein